MTMSLRRVTIGPVSAPEADLTARAGLPIRLAGGRLHPGEGVVVEEDLVRRRWQMRDVLAAGVGRQGRRVEYHMLNGVRTVADRQLERLHLRYELTAMLGLPLGWEAAKTLGHVHVAPPRTSIGYPEIVEVLHGEAGFLIQDFAMTTGGPRSRRAWLVRALPGDWVVLPPDLAHVTIDLGAGPLVFSDVIDRRARGVYAGVAQARGFAWYVAADGEFRPNPRYTETPPIEEITASDWSGQPRGLLYEAFRDDPASFAWLSDPARFASLAPVLAARIASSLD